MRFFAQNTSRIVLLSIHTNQAIRRLVSPILLAFRSSTKKSAIFEIFTWSPLCYFAKNGHFRHFCEKCYFSPNRSFFMRFFAQHKSRIVQPSMNTNQAIRRLVLNIFLAFPILTKNIGHFCKFFLGPPFGTLQKTAIFDTFAKNVNSPLMPIFSCGFFAQNKPRIVYLSIHTNQAIRRLVFPIFLAFRSSTKKSAIFENFPFVPPLLLCQKWPFSTLLRKMLFLP